MQHQTLYLESLMHKTIIVPTYYFYLYYFIIYLWTEKTLFKKQFLYNIYYIKCVFYKNYNKYYIAIQ